MYGRRGWMGCCCFRRWLVILAAATPSCLRRRYLEYAKQRGFEMMFIWACPPLAVSQQGVVVNMRSGELPIPLLHLLLRSSCARLVLQPACQAAC